MSVYRTIVALSLNGSRVEKGTEIELSPEDAARLDPADIKLVSDIAAPEAEVALADIPLEDMSQAQLKERAKELGLSASGSKADLAERITLHLEGVSTDGPAPEGEGAGEGAATDGPAPEGEITNE